MGRGKKVFLLHLSKGHQTMEPFKGHQAMESSKGHQTMEPSKGHQATEPSISHQIRVFLHIFLLLFFKRANSDH